MIIVHNHLGGIKFTKPFFASLIANTTNSCFGVAAMNASTPIERLADVLPITSSLFNIHKGIKVRINGGRVSIAIHISVMYGVNVSAVVGSIKNKLRYAVKEQTHLTVEKIDVYIDGLTT